MLPDESGGDWAGGFLWPSGRSMKPRMSDLAATASSVLDLSRRGDRGVVVVPSLHLLPLLQLFVSIANRHDFETQQYVK